MGEASFPSKKTCSANSTPVLYFGYGSNLWRHQMALRCPTSQYLGVGRLDGWKWTINERGYADVVELPASNTSPGKNEAPAAYADSVFGLVYTLQTKDEKRLDKNEGVPFAYTKEYHAVELWEPARDSSDEKVDVTKPPSRTVDMLVYVDRVRTGEAKPQEEYVHRMNEGIRDALKMGVPEEYVSNVMRRFIPEEKLEGEDDEEREKALRQAARFEDESGVFVRKMRRKERRR